MEQMKIQPEDWKEDYKEFDEATEKFYKGEIGCQNLQGDFRRFWKLCAAWRKCKYAASSYVRRCNGPGKA